MIIVELVVVVEEWGRVVGEGTAGVDGEGDGESNFGYIIRQGEGQ